MSYYNITLLEAPGSCHAQSHEDLLPLLQASFASLGLPCAVQPNTLDPAAVNIIVNYLALTDTARMAGHDCVILQLEQLEGACLPRMLRIFEQARVILDYSLENMAFLRQRGFRNVRYLPLGFHECLCRVPTLPKDIDVLFYGYPAARRKTFLEELKPHCRVQALFGFYGAQRDAFIARSKVVLNIHQLPARIMEQVRISYLLNNNCCVVSEESAHNPYEGMIATAPFERLLETCLYYVNHESERLELARQGAALFARRTMIENLRCALGNGL